MKQKKSALIKVILLVIIVVAIAPMLINVGLIFTDIICEKHGLTLTAYGLNNVQWLDFWKQYLAIIISFIGICLVYLSSCKDREMQLNERKAQQYLEYVTNEEKVLVRVIKNFNIANVYDVIVSRVKSNTFDHGRTLADLCANMDSVHVEFEILTNLCDDFKRCDGCENNPCIDRLIREDLRNQFYDMEKCYFELLKHTEVLFQRLDREQEILNQLNLESALYCNNQRMIELCKHNGMREQMETSEAEMATIKKRIECLEKEKIELESIENSYEEIRKIKCNIEQVMRPKFTRYCKDYINIKKQHATELRHTGEIKHNKVKS